MITAPRLNRILACFGTVSLTSCAALVQQIDLAVAQQLEATRPICAGEADCVAKWEAAQVWVSKNAGMKIQTVTTAIIETYNATDYSTGLAMQVTKESLGDGRYKIVAHAQCRSCAEYPADAILRFNRDIAAAKP